MNQALSFAVAFTTAAAALLVAKHASADPVQVEVTSSNPNVVLYQVKEQAVATAGAASASAMSYEIACVVPCTKSLERNATYFVGGDGVSGSSAFLLPAAAQSKIVVEAGHRGPWMLGLGAAVVGGIAAGVGLPLGLAGEDGLSTAGWAMAGIGSALLIGGIIVARNNGTDVKTAEGIVLAKSESRKESVALTVRGLTF